MRLFFLGYFLLLPFQWALSPTDGVDLALIRIVSLLGFALWLVVSLLRGRILLPTGAAVFFFLSFVFVATLSFFWSENGIFALRKMVFLLSFAPLFFVLSSWLRESPSGWLSLVHSYVLGAFAAGLVGITIFFSQFFFSVASVFGFLTTQVLPFFLGNTFGGVVAEYPSLLVNISGATILRASGVFPDPHIFAYYMGMAAPLALALYFLDRSKWWWAVAGVVLLAADLLSFSRGGYVGLLLSGAWVVFALWKHHVLNIRRGVVFVGMMLIGIVIVVTTPLGARFTSIFSGDDGSNTERLRLWQEAVVHIGERPFFGVGLGNYSLAVKPGAMYREPIYAHNLFLDITVELGLVGLSLFLGLCGVVFWRLARIFFASGDVMALGLMASLTLFFGHSFFETPLFSVHILPALLLVLALGVSYKGHEN